jgi:hypothetical protein
VSLAGSAELCDGGAEPATATATATSGEAEPGIAATAEPGGREGASQQPLQCHLSHPRRLRRLWPHQHHPQMVLPPLFIPLSSSLFTHNSTTSRFMLFRFLFGSRFTRCLENSTNIILFSVSNKLKPFIVSFLCLSNCVNTLVLCARQDILGQYSMVNLELFNIVDEIKKVSKAFVVHPKNVNAENSTSMYLSS